MSAALDILTDACTAIPKTIRKMFGGHGFFAPNGGMFAGILSDDEIILKLSGDARDELIALGGKPWTYHGKNKPVTMHDWIIVPSEFMDDHDLLSAWAKRAQKLAPAKAAAKKKAAVRAPAAKKAAASKPVAKKALKTKKAAKPATNKSAKKTPAKKKR